MCVCMYVCVCMYLCMYIYICPIWEWILNCQFSQLQTLNLPLLTSIAASLIEVWSSTCLWIETEIFKGNLILCQFS